MFSRTLRNRAPAVLGDVSNARAVLETCRQRIATQYASELPTKAAVNRLLQDAVTMFQHMPNVSEIKRDAGCTAETKMSICGDVHGQARDFFAILDRIGGLNKNNSAFFNGDFVDRGPDGAEIFLSLCALKLIDADGMHMNRGNHETKKCTDSYGFMRELRQKFGQDTNITKAFLTCFSTLPLAARVDNRLMIVHGGIPRKRDTTVDDINDVHRFGINEPHGDPGLLLWSDPVEGAGRGAAFNTQDTKKFLSANKCSMLIRSHECVPDGYQLYHDDRCVTIFSAPGYCGLKNTAAYIEYDFVGPSNKSTHLKFHQYSQQSKDGSLVWHKPKKILIPAALP